MYARLYVDCGDNVGIGIASSGALAYPGDGVAKGVGSGDGAAVGVPIATATPWLSSKANAPPYTNGPATISCPMFAATPDEFGAGYSNESGGGVG